LEVGTRTEICAVLDNKGSWPQTVSVEFSMADFTMGVPFQPIAAPGNPRVVTLPPHSTVRTCLYFTPLTPGHKCFQIRISQQGYEDIVSQKNLDVGEHLRPGVEDQLEITVGNPKTFAADVQIVVRTGCPGWQAWTEPEILRNVPPGATRQVTLRVIPPAAGATLGSGCYIDVESYIHGELISGIRKVDLPPVHPPFGEPPYAERELSIDPDPPRAGQPAQVCAELHNFAAVDQTVDLTLYVADFGIGIPFQEVGQLPNVVIPAHTTVKRCLTWITSPGSLNRCLQIRIQQRGYEDITSQRCVELQPAVKISEGTVVREIPIGNPTGHIKVVDMDIKKVGLPPGVNVSVAQNSMTLEPGQVMTNTVRIEPPVGAVGPWPGEGHMVAVEAFIDEELVGGVQIEFQVEGVQIYLPIILKLVSR
jgi:hypothetical protein